MKPFRETMDIEGDFVFRFEEEREDRETQRTFMLHGTTPEDNKRYSVQFYKKIEDLVKSKGLDPKELLARGGFEKQEDIDLILKYGWDYEGREHRHGFDMETSTYALALTMMSGIHMYADSFFSPFYNIAKSLQGKPGLALYDKNHLKLSENEDKANMLTYDFIYPDRKLDALIGVIQFNVVESERQRKQREDEEFFARFGGVFGK